MRTVDGLSQLFCRMLEVIMVICISGMFLLVLVNVLLRFIFNSGIDVAEELPRFLFVWMIFIGAIVAIRDKSHISVGMFVERMPVAGKKICYFLCQILMGVCSLALFWGTWVESDILATTYSAVLNVNMLMIFGVSWLTGGCIFLSSVFNIFRLFLACPDDMFLVTDSKDE
ncbi:TRAP transporter small permease [Klebsiella huaxiensis]|uniref:TRAP transporter small permease n=1 Tax=Klebsiella huaxiensis TaxID=2153354 RepID=UPI002F324165